jgi:hypothetical protein
MLLVELFSHAALYPADFQFIQIAMNTRDGNRPRIQFLYATTPAELSSSIIVRMWAQNPVDRPTAAVVEKQLVSVLSALLARDNSAAFEYDVFVSYCHGNSAEAKGRKGKADPRVIARYLGKAEHEGGSGLRVFLDVDVLGPRTLFGQLSEAMGKSRMAVICVSDEYAESGYCQREIEFALNTVRMPIVVVVVGEPHTTGNVLPKWRVSGAGFLIGTPVWTDCTGDS